MSNLFDTMYHVFMAVMLAGAWVTLIVFGALGVMFLVDKRRKG